MFSKKNSLKQIQPGSLHKRAKGPATVELAFALFFIIGLFMVCLEYFSIFGVKQRINYAAYMAERSQTVDGNPISTANQLNNGAQVDLGSGVTVKKFLNLPVNLKSPWSGNAMNFEVSSKVNMPSEPIDSGDNL